MRLADLIDDLNEKAIALALASAHLDAMIGMIDETGTKSLDEEQMARLMKGLRNIAEKLSVARGGD